MLLATCQLLFTCTRRICACMYVHLFFGRSVADRQIKFERFIFCLKENLMSKIVYHVFVHFYVEAFGLRVLWCQRLKTFFLRH